ncbi:MAG: creatininase family protein [Candidatus Dormibacteria bacterium]
MPASIHFADLTSPRARALLDAGPVPVLLLPVGAVEPHGPHAPLGTDSIISTTICERAAVALSEDRRVRAFVLPEIAFGVTRYSAAFTGAVTISEGTLLAIVVEVCASLRAQGFRHQVIVNSHFEPAQVETLRRAALDARVGLLDLTRRAVAQQLTPEFQSGAAHAGRYETSLVLSTRPELVEAEIMRRLPAYELNMPAAMAAGQTDFLAMGMDRAYCGAPAEATAEEGEATLATLSRLLIDLIREQAGTEPAP